MDTRILRGFQEFKDNVKVGDYLLGFAMREKIKVTAIGEQRFLYTKETCKKEMVSMIYQATFHWELVIKEPTVVDVE